MKVAVINFSGNVGKSTVSKHLLLPRLPGNPEFLAVETINSDEGGAETVRAQEFGRLLDHLLLLDSAVVDVGASNIEAFAALMKQYRGSHEDFDLFVIPVVKDNKQVKDTINTIIYLKSIGVPAKKIRVVFNKVEAGESVDDVFSSVIDFHEDTKSFTLRLNALIEYSELYQKLRLHDTSITELVNDTNDYKAMLRQAKDDAEKQHCIDMISMRRLALSAKDNLDAAYAALTK